MREGEGYLMVAGAGTIPMPDAWDEDFRVPLLPSHAAAILKCTLNLYACTKSFVLRVE